MVGTPPGGTSKRLNLNSCCYPTPTPTPAPPAQVRGFVQHESSPAKVATLVGKWDHSVYYCKGDMPKQQQKENDFHNVPDCFPLWQRAPPSPSPTRYNLTSFAITLNEITPGLEVRKRWGVWMCTEGERGAARVSFLSLILIFHISLIRDGLG